MDWHFRLLTVTGVMLLVACGDTIITATPTTPTTTAPLETASPTATTNPLAPGWADCLRRLEDMGVAFDGNHKVDILDVKKLKDACNNAPEPGPNETRDMRLTADGLRLVASEALDALTGGQDRIQWAKDVFAEVDFMRLQLGVLDAPSGT